jgi:transcriptional regulator GlxA family with amidase domain
MVHRVALVIFPGFQVLDLAAAAAFELANGELGRTHYRVDVTAEQANGIASSVGVSVDARRLGAAETVLVTGALGIAHSSPALSSYLAGQIERASRVASICTGAFILAQAGVLDGRRATTHWAFTTELQLRHPAVRVQEDRIYVKDGQVWTSAGMTAGLDLAVGMVEEDLGADIARNVARKMVMYYRRPGGQSQFSALLDLQPQTDRIHKTLLYARANLHRELSVERLAEVANLSARQFSRAFRSETGQSPARAIECMRVEAARQLIASGVHPLSVVAARSGFGEMERMRRAFLRTCGQPPQSIRRSENTLRRHAVG